MRVSSHLPMQFLLILFLAGTAVSTSICKNTNYPIPFPLTNIPNSTDSIDPNVNDGCPPGFYCPNYVKGDEATYASFCLPTEECLAIRYDKKYCEAQGVYEPSLCLAGYYCPTGKSQIICPSGHHCPLGTQTPWKCHKLMHCPEGMTMPPYDYSSILVTVLIDIITVGFVLFIFRRRRLWRERLNEVIDEMRNEDERRAKAAEEAKAKAATEEESSQEGLTPATASEMVQSTMSNEEVFPVKKVSAINRDALRKSPAYAVLERGVRLNRGNMMPLFIQFEELSVRVPFKGEKKQLLRGITGAICPGHVTAIMGPSGAGKTVFMTSLLNKVESNWSVTGELSINGSTGVSLGAYQHMMGYVPQDDVMHPELTVMENVWFNAELRLPRDWSAEERMRYVAAVIRTTGLEDVAHVVVGDGTIPNGVNRKRVCVAMEFAAAPSAVFLDEPTTGLDAATALDLCTLLKDIAIQAQLTVAMVIHQPRVEIWESLDEVLLIAPGGRTVYQGPQRLAEDYFRSQIGLDFSIGNPADIILDGISANQEACEKAWLAYLDDHPEIRHPDPMADYKKALEARKTCKEAEREERQRLKKEAKAKPENADGECAIKVVDGEEEEKEEIIDPETESEEKNELEMHMEVAPPAKNHSGFIRQIILIHYRSILKQCYHAPNIIFAIFLSICAAAIMGTAGVRTLNVGILKKPMTIINPRHSIYMVPMMCMFYFIAIASSTSATAIRALSNNREQYWKEAATGRINKIAYFLAMTTAEIYRLILTTFHFTLVAYFMWNPLIDFWLFLLIILLAVFCNDSQSAMLGLVITPKHAPLLTTVVAVFVALLNGFPDIPSIIYAAYSFYLSEFGLTRYVKYQQLTQTNEVYEKGYFKYRVGRDALDLCFAVLAIIVYRIIAYLIMVFTYRNKQR